MTVAKNTGSDTSDLRKEKAPLTLVHQNSADIQTDHRFHMGVSKVIFVMSTIYLTAATITGTFNNFPREPLSDYLTPFMALAWVASGCKSIYHYCKHKAAKFAETKDTILAAPEPTNEELPPVIQLPGLVVGGNFTASPT